MTDENEINSKMSKILSDRTEQFCMTFRPDEIELRHEIMGSIVKDLPLISWKGYEAIDKIVKDTLEHFIIIPVVKVHDAFDKAASSIPDRDDLDTLVAEWPETDHCPLDDLKSPPCDDCMSVCARGDHILSHRAEDSRKLLLNEGVDLTDEADGHCDSCGKDGVRIVFQDGKRWCNGCYVHGPEDEGKA